jgi:tetratricopeptide (TPR) repeat protein
MCPQCNFIGASGEFKVTIKKPSKQHWVQDEKLRREYPASKRFIRYAERLTAEGAALREIGDSYLRASWAERTCSVSRNRPPESVALERECQLKAVRLYLSALQQGALAPSAQHFYLVAELYRRTGNFKASIDYFDKAIADIENESYYKLFLEDAGPQADVVWIRVRAHSSVQRGEWRQMLNNLPAKMLGDLSLESAKEWETRLTSVGAVISIQDQSELPQYRQECLSFVREMREFAANEDSENKPAQSGAGIVIYLS